ncbi:HEAT repeat domain-containing protein [Chloroflexi bacterium TSY]|nr:HEAT repeat domain-containing protein [Chloroflexi bacterium TSY]
MAQSTTFADLPSVQTAIRTIARSPFDNTAASTLTTSFRQVLPTDFDDHRIDRGVKEFLDALREEFAAVSTLQQTLSVQAAIQSNRSIERIETLLQQLLDGPQSSAETLQDYLTWVIDQHRYLDPRGSRQTVRQVQVPLDEIYVSLRAEEEPALSVSDRYLYEDDLAELQNRGDLLGEELEDLRENILARYLKHEQPSRRGQATELNVLVNTHPKLVILGDPGAGKTTLMRYLALQNALAMRQSKTEVQGLGQTRLPLFLRIATYAEHGNGRSLSDFLPLCICGEQTEETPLSVLIQERLQTGDCLILLDGLDEIVEPDQRAEIAQAINSLVREHERTGNRFVITSRVAGYRTAPLSGDIAHYRVQDMNDAQIKRFLERWCHAVERFQTPNLTAQAQNAQAEIDNIMAAVESNTGVRRLATNPLLLRTLALIHRTGATLPERRIELYRLAAETLIRDWQLARGIPQEALVHEKEATRLLAELAAWMHAEKPAGIATEGEVRHQLALVKGRLLNQEPDHPDVEIAVDDFLTRIREHTGLFVERAPRRFGFMHLTFEEYFAARWLVARPPKAAARIRTKLHQPRWEEPILLAIGFYGEEFPDDVDSLVQEAILGRELGGPSPYEEILQRDLLFALRCLGDQEVGPTLQQNLISQALHAYFVGTTVGRIPALESLILQRITEIQRSKAGHAFLNAFINKLSDESESVRRSAALALSNATLSEEAVSALLQTLHDESESVRRSAAEALRTATKSEEAVSALLQTLQDESESVRSNAAFALRTATKSEEVVAALLQALQDESESVRRSAALALSTATKSEEVVAALLQALQDESESVRRSAAFALRTATKSEEVVAALLQALQDESESVRRSAALALSNATKSGEVVAALLQALQDESASVRSSVALALSNATLSEEAVAALLQALQDESESVRSNAAEALRTATKSEEAVAALLQALQDESESVCRSAALALSNATKSEKAVAALLQALQDESESVRSSVALALSNATLSEKAVAALLQALQDESAFVRHSAAFALSNATKSEKAEAALLQALQDESEPVRRSAAYALAQLTSHPTFHVNASILSALETALPLPRLYQQAYIQSASGLVLTSAKDELFKALSNIAPRPTVSTDP